MSKTFSSVFFPCSHSMLSTHLLYDFVYVQCTYFLIVKLKDCNGKITESILDHYYYIFDIMERQCNHKSYNQLFFHGFNPSRSAIVFLSVTTETFIVNILLWALCTIFRKYELIHILHILWLHILAHTYVFSFC